MAERREPPAGVVPSLTKSTSNVEEETDQLLQLTELTADVRDQDDLERDMALKADQLILEEADERDQRIIDKLKTSIEKLLSQKATLEQRLAAQAGKNVGSKTQTDLIVVKEKLSEAEAGILEAKQRIDKRHEGPEVDEAGPGDSSGNKMLPNETQREFLIRTGKITPFSKEFTDNAATLAQRMYYEEMGSNALPLSDAEDGDRSHQNLRKPGFEEDVARPVEKGKKRMQEVVLEESEEEDGVSTPRKRQRPSRLKSEDSEDEFIPGKSESEEEYVLDELDKMDIEKDEQPATREDLSGIDDGNERVYQARLNDWVKRRSSARRAANVRMEDEDNEWFLPHPTKPDTELEEGLRIPGDIYPSLFNYQRTGVQWLWELYLQNVGGIIGDEMGLGKTIQIISFLASLHYSKKITKPIIVVTPATVMKQWVNEFHAWWPAFRVSILHSSGSGMGKGYKSGNISSDDDVVVNTTSSPEARRIVKRVVEKGHVLITTYTGLRTYGRLLIPIDWGFAVLDEGHKIRNPNTEVTLFCKQLRTPHRVILSGTPMQNNLTELWSLFDFVFPMRLGNLLNFREHFEIPIKLGGYANATNLQIQVATKCAETLKDAISPYLLQRLKVDVAADLPKKTEQVIFCKLTSLQRKAYEFYLSSDDCKRIFAGKLNTLRGVDVLRKICNHPDLEDRAHLLKKPGYDYGAPEKSGKMLVVKALVQMFKKFGHRTLLFCQTRIMLDIIQKFLRSLGGITFCRMDGTTPIKERQTLVNEFNENTNIDVFLLTTKVGGLGVNLTGADRVIIYDPDWNPSTDVQARERAWRLGQKKQVAIYRLMTAGTIEEKIYHRQIFKQFLTNKVMKDPTQRRTFQMTDLHDLFTLAPEGGTTETAQLFSEAKVTYEDSSKDEKKPMRKSNHGSSNAPEETIGDINGVSHLENMQTEGDGGEDGPSEDRLMQGIFARSGVHSALEHEEILNNKQVRADPAIIDREARRVASIAAKELSKNEKSARQLPSGTPTWTGEAGVAGRPEERRPRPKGPSSSSILAGLQNRQVNRSSPGPVSGDPKTAGYKAQALMRKIQEFFRVHDNRVVSQMILDHFSSQCKTAEDTARFMACLREVAVMKDGARARGSGRGVWNLKDEWK